MCVKEKETGRKQMSKYSLELKTPPKEMEGAQERRRDCNEGGEASEKDSGKSRWHG